MAQAEQNMQGSGIELALGEKPNDHQQEQTQEPAQCFCTALALVSFLLSVSAQKVQHPRKNMP